MCGLIAILNWEDGSWPSSLEATKAVHRGLQRMHYRGTQLGIIVQEDQTILGHVRLPIINLSDKASQPMQVGGTVGVFVGEIFNYEDYDSDTEFLINEFSRNKTFNFHQFDGFWSAVFVKTGWPTIVTDYLSQKPLYFFKDKLLVASEPEAIISALGYQPPWDHVYFSNVLKWGYDCTGRTPWEGLQQLPAGCTLTQAQGWTPAPYWSWQLVPNAKDLRSALVESTKNRLVGDRDVALLLSGGLDSTIVFKILTQILKKEVKVFHVENDEKEYVMEALDGYKSTPIVPSGNISLLECISRHQVPVDLGSVKPQISLAEGVSQGNFRVAMSGDGADELFGGYRRAKDYDSQMSDTFCELPYYHLPRLDRIMMSETVELRTPYLAPSVVKYAMGLQWKDRTDKQALKIAFKDLVPKSILEREKKPLKTEEVMTGGTMYRQKLINIWKEEHNDD